MVLSRTFSAALRLTDLSIRLASHGNRIMKSLSRLAQLDALTGLYNRNALIPRLENEISRANRYKRPLSLAIIDLDHFKAINDTLGHNAGDLALKYLAETLARFVRTADIVARHGGDEFIIVFPETTAENARIPLERLRIIVESLVCKLGPRDWRNITLSIGVAQLKSNTRAPEDLIALADQALYRAKTSGRNRVEVNS
jgi:diguanylate cyclase (GGDEF)-like protein